MMNLPIYAYEFALFGKPYNHNALRGFIFPVE